MPLGNFFASAVRAYFGTTTYSDYQRNVISTALPALVAPIASVFAFGEAEINELFILPIV